MRARQRDEAAEVPLPECLRWHLVTGDWPRPGQFETWLACWQTPDAEKVALWRQYGRALEREGQARGWRRLPASQRRPWQKPHDPRITQEDAAMPAATADA